jgi:hypothetical protein
MYPDLAYSGIQIQRVFLKGARVSSHLLSRLRTTNPDIDADEYV